MMVCTCYCKSRSRSSAAGGIRRNTAVHPLICEIHATNNQGPGR